jgi:hypothetical protein
MLLCICKAYADSRMVLEVWASSEEFPHVVVANVQSANVYTVSFMLSLPNGKPMHGNYEYQLTAELEMRGVADPPHSLLIFPGPVPDQCIFPSIGCNIHIARR